MEVETFNDFSKAADALEHAQRTVERGLQEQASSSEKSNSTVNALTALKEEISEHLSQLAKFEKIKEWVDIAQKLMITASNQGRILGKRIPEEEH